MSNFSSDHGTAAVPAEKLSVSTPRHGGFFGKRRDFIINRRYQLGASLMTAATVLVLLILINLIVYTLTMSNTEKILAGAPELAALVKAQDRVELFLIVLISFVYLAGVFLVTILETHRTAGAAYSLGKKMADVRLGRFKTRLQLRRGDHLRELETAFNDMSQSLEDRSWKEIDTLQRLAKEADKIADQSDASRLSSRLRDLVERKRSLVS